MLINPIIRGRVVSKTNALDVKLKTYFNNFTLESQEKKIISLNTYSLGSSKAENSMPCTRCFMRTRVVFKTARFKQTALKLSWWIMRVIGSLFADASALCLQHIHSRGWFNLADEQCEHLHQSRVTNWILAILWILAFTRITAFFAFFVFWLKIVRSNHKFLCGSHIEKYPTTHWRHKRKHGGEREIWK